MLVNSKTLTQLLNCHARGWGIIVGPNGVQVIAVQVFTTLPELALLAIGHTGKHMQPCKLLVPCQHITQQVVSNTSMGQYAGGGYTLYYGLTDVHAQCVANFATQLSNGSVCLKLLAGGTIV